MHSDLIEHLGNLKPPPVLDVLGQWVSLPNAKTASTSIHSGIFNKRFISRHRGYRNWQRVWWSVTIPNFDNLVLFTFVRNPWDRVLSAFVQKQENTNNPRNKIDSSWSFCDYVEKVLGVKGPYVDVNFTPQYPKVVFRRKRMPGLFIGRFERLEEDWGILAEKLGSTSQLPRKNSTPHGHYTTYYNNKAREIVKRLYQPEIEFLGYKFGQ